jgi:hypothetical protein
VIEYWYVALPLAVVGTVVGALVHRARYARAAERQRAFEEAHHAWLAGPAPPLSLPSRFSERWFADNVPYLHPGQVPVLMDELRARGWKDDRIAQRVGPFLSANPYL